MAAGKKFPLNVIIYGTDRATGTLGKVQAKLAAIDKAAGFSRFGVGIKTFGNKIGEAGKQVAQLGAAMAGLGAAGLVLADRTAEAGSEIRDTAFKLGLTGEELQKFRYAAKLSGTDSEALGKSVAFLNKNLGKARVQGKGDILTYLKQLGVQTKDSNGKFKTTGEIFLEAADAISKIKDPMKRAAAETAIFGKSGVEIGTLLREGAGGIKALGDEAQRLGIIIDKETLDRAEAFGDSMDRARFAVKGLGLTVGAALLPVMQPLVDLFVDLTSKHQDDIKAFGKTLAGLVPSAQAVADGFTKIGNAIDFAVKVFGPVVDFLGGPANVLIGIIGFKLVAAAYSAAQAFVALGAAMLLTPIGQVITAITLGVAAGYWLVKNWDKVAKLWHKIVGAIGEVFVSVIGGIKSFFVGMLDSIINKLRSFGNMLPDWVKRRVGIDVAMSGPAPSGGAALMPSGAPIMQGFNQSNMTPDPSKVQLEVKFDNAPKGLRVSSKSEGPADIDVTQGYSMVTP